MEKELHSLPDHMSLLPLFIGVHVAQSLIFLVVLFGSLFCLFCFFAFSFGHCTVCPCSNYGFWLYLWYLRTFLINNSARLSIKYYLALISIGTIERIVPFRPNSAAMPQSIAYQRQINNKISQAKHPQRNCKEMVIISWSMGNVYTTSVIWSRNT